MRKPEPGLLTRQQVVDGEIRVGSTRLAPPRNCRSHRGCRPCWTQARERGDATEFAGHKDVGTTCHNYFTEAAKVKPLW
jgi:hypothetical protein